MSVRLRLLGLTAAALLLAGSVFLGLVASDVLGWRGDLERSDVAFATPRGAPALEVPETRLPSGLVQGLLGVKDDVAFREAVQGFRQSNPRRPPRSLVEASLKSRAETELARVSREDSSRERRSLVATMRGGLAFEEARGGGAQAAVFLRRSLAQFRQAIALDESNENAKYNLELALALQRAARSGSGGGDSVRRGDPLASGAGAATAGSGY
jgi:hypothetical protein